MPSITIPIGSKVTQTERKNIEIRVPNTKFWIIGHQDITSKLWDVFLVDPQTKRKELIRANTSTKVFSMYTNIVLKQEFPYEGKRNKNFEFIKKIIKKIK